MTTKYTQGPWINVTGNLVRDSHGNCIAGDSSAIRSEANARLIASAPELLEALEQVKRYCKQWQAANGPFPNGDGRTLILKNVEAVIAKARGL